MWLCGLIPDFALQLWIQLFRADHNTKLYSKERTGKYLPDVEVRAVKELLEEEVLDLSAANGTDIPYEGWMGIEFTLPKNAVSGMSDKPVRVPILVASSDYERPIIGFNVIEELAQRDSSEASTPSEGYKINPKEVEAVQALKNETPATVREERTGKYLPDVEVRAVKELLEEEVLDLSAANGTDIPYEGWMGIEFTREVCYVSAEGYKINPKEVEAVQALKNETPATVRERKIRGVEESGQQGQIKVKYSTYPDDTASSSEKEYLMLTEKRQTGPTLNVEAEEFIPRIEAQDREPEEALLLEQHAEEEHVGERHCTDEVSATESESEDEQKDADTKRRPTRARQPRRVYTYNQFLCSGLLVYRRPSCDLYAVPLKAA
ncbi:hypothetical protein L3Q82_001074 [Scortum barcoo]|uniref:Uncharacterized protein n=1 Tax=Scortum barcoo TaxID=214431 RepID=A0ACB8WB53_9TELE|nr:hypothetical protein L3Q82_001074 [Scortum barcoo]